jgi:hypothetical protein
MGNLGRLFIDPKGVNLLKVEGQPNPTNIVLITRLSLKVLRPGKYRTLAIFCDAPPELNREPTD